MNVQEERLKRSEKLEESWSTVVVKTRNEAVIITGCGCMEQEIACRLEMRCQGVCGRV